MSELVFHNRDFEGAIFRKLTIAPEDVVLLSNESDATPPQDVLDVTTDLEHWFDLAKELIYMATDVVVYASQLGVGLVKELRACKEKSERLGSAGRRCYLFVDSPECPKAIEELGLNMRHFRIFLRQDREWRSEEPAVA